jgi:hypothetical protein
MSVNQNDMEKMKLITFSFILLLLNTFCAQTKHEQEAVPIETLKVINKEFSLFIKQNTGKINPLFWGTNFLFWVEDDASLLDKRIETSLKNMPCTILRYPGGTVADNFHWKSNMLGNKYLYPYEQGASETDFDEFYAFCNRIGAEPVLVVNTDSWCINQDIDGGVKEASDWVQYCKDKGYKAKYWEIGNETYLSPFLTATEYGQLVKKYAMAMKAVDPTIKISANGQHDPNVVSTKERIPSAQWEIIRQKYQNIKSSADASDAKQYVNKYKDPNDTKGTQKWWNNVAMECGDYIDMITVHSYFGGSNDMSDMTAELNSVRDVFKTKYPNREYMMCLTEYNCTNTSLNLNVSGLFDGIGRFLSAKVDIATFWTLRFSGTFTNNFPLLTYTSKDESFAYQILQLLSTNLKGDLLKTSSVDQIFPYASYDGNQLTVVVCGRGITSDPVSVTMSLAEMNQMSLIDAQAYDAPASYRESISLVKRNVITTISDTSCVFKVMPNQTVILRFKKK